MPAGLLGIEELDRDQIASILARAKDFQPMQSQSLKKLDQLRGKMIVNLFFEASTRTRTSFEIAAKRLGAEELDQLRGKMIVNLFFEASTRTRTSFEIAAKRLGADAVSI